MKIKNNPQSSQQHCTFFPSHAEMTVQLLLPSSSTLCSTHLGKGERDMAKNRGEFGSMTQGDGWELTGGRGLKMHTWVLSHWGGQNWGRGKTDVWSAGKNDVELWKRSKCAEGSTKVWGRRHLKCFSVNKSGWIFVTKTYRIWSKGRLETWKSGWSPLCKTSIAYK